MRFIEKNLPWLLGTVALAAFSYYGLHKAEAAEWVGMNDHINQTNFIVQVGERGLCSGTLVALKPKALILTADHCVEDNITVKETDETDPDDGTITKVKREVYTDMKVKQVQYHEFTAVGTNEYTARIVAHAKKYDLALIELRADSVPMTEYSHFLPEGMTVERGDPVMEVGNPLGMDATAAEGIVSSTTRMIVVGDQDDVPHPFYQVSAATSPGNSGGALYKVMADGSAYLIGVPAASIIGYQGMGMVIPHTSIKKFLKENCFDAVYDDKAKSHADCLKDKLDKENARREKAGEPPLKPPTDDSVPLGLMPKETTTHLSTLLQKPEKEAPKSDRQSCASALGMAVSGYLAGKFDATTISPAIDACTK